MEVIGVRGSILKNLICFCSIFFLASNMQASDVNQMTMSLVADTIFEVKTDNKKSNLYITGEGTAKFESPVSRVYAYARCGAVDTIVEGHNSVYAGVGDCEFSSPSGGTLYGTFQTPEGKGDRGFIILKRGKGDLEEFNGSKIPLIARVNPRMTGKMVFHFDNTQSKNITE